ncbi:MAG: phosphoribosylamine--glycine ligase [Chlorobi bacterium]|nr:phosphoribosylamine--glycine ligase [Chlorobiota bacterium]
MNVLLLGAGGREHALAWKLSQSPKTTKLFTAPGNAGTEECGENVSLNIDDFNEVKSFVIQNKIKMVVVGPEAPLVNGFHDNFLKDDLLKSIPVIGPTKQGAELEGSKDFAKGFMKKCNIPTAAYQTFDKEGLEKSYRFLETMKAPYVLKADGLAAGKGVLILDDINEAKAEMKEMLENAKFGEASKKVVVEEFLSGIELSVFVLADGNSYKILPSAKDYKRIGEGDTGLNTGGMGSISPVPFADKTFMDKIKNKIIKPTIEGLKTEGLNYKGFIFFGLINVEGEPFVIEYNVRMGDPEAESVIPRIKSDLMDLFEGVAEGNIADREIEIDERYCASVFLVAGGYPEKYEKGNVMTGFENVNDSILFHAGTKKDFKSGQILTNGGRVLAVSSFGETMKSALETSYKNVELIQFKGKNFRKDLGKDLLNFF